MTKLTKQEKQNSYGGFWGILMATITIINVTIGIATGIANIVTSAKENEKAEKIRNEPKPVKSQYMVGNTKPFTNIF